MIRRDMQPVQVVVYGSGVDEYGQPRQTIQQTRVVDMFIRPYSNDVNGNPKFNDYELIALTEDRLVSEVNSVILNDKVYDVMYVIPSFRYNQLFLQEVK